MRWALLLSVATGVTTVACDSTCERVPRPTVTDPDTPLIIGGTWGDALVTIVGERSGSLTWQPSEPQVQGLPAPGETGVTVVIHEPDSAEEIDLEREGGHRHERLYCPDRVEAELELELRTDDGALDLRVPALATFDDPSSASITAELRGDDLGLTPPDASLHLRLHYGDGLDGPGGALILDSDDAESGASMTVELATWTLD